MIPPVLCSIPRTASSLLWIGVLKPFGCIELSYCKNICQCNSVYLMNSAVIHACIGLALSLFIKSLRDRCLNVTWLVAVAVRCHYVLLCPLWVMPQDPSVIFSSA
ncbi:Uncharacterized protein DAT39_006729, partial [Clarias magur]